MLRCVDTVVGRQGEDKVLCKDWWQIQSGTALFQLTACCLKQTVVKE